MRFSDLKTIARLSVSAAKAQKVNNTLLELLLNEGVRDLAHFGVLLPTFEDFSSTADTGTYLLTSVVADFLVMDKPGLWWYDGTEWKRLRPRTEKWLDVNVPNWRSMGSGTPEWYYQTRNNLVVVPAPEETVTDAFKLYYGALPPTMTSDNHYPFGNTVEIGELSILWDAIIAYYSWKVLPFVAEATNTKEAEATYKRIRQEKVALLERRLDIQADYKASLKGRKVGG